MSISQGVGLCRAHIIVNVLKFLFDLGHVQHDKYKVFMQYSCCTRAADFHK